MIQHTHSAFINSVGCLADTDANMDNVVTAVDCGFPNMTKGAEVLMNHFASTTENSVVVLKCAEGLFPNHSVTTVCTSKGKWNPDPATHTCRPLEMNGTTGINTISHILYYTMYICMHACVHY